MFHSCKIVPLILRFLEFYYSRPSLIVLERERYATAFDRSLDICVRSAEILIYVVGRGMLYFPGVLSIFFRLFSFFRSFLFVKRRVSRNHLGLSTMISHSAFRKHISLELDLLPLLGVGLIDPVVKT